MILKPKVKGSILLAFSGGVDSVVLLDLLLNEGHEVELFHLDHQLRPTSARDAEFCRQVASSKGLQLHLYQEDVQAYCEERGLGIEEGARKLRYELLRRIKEERGLAYIATAHHLDDQMETFFINLFRGSGTRGLGGIHPLQDDLYRPLLSYRKSEILDYAAAKKLTYVQDETNFEPMYYRNQLRLELIPEIEEDYCPSLAKRLEQTMEILREEDEFLDQLLEERIDLDKTLYPLEEIRSLAPVLKKRLLRKKFRLSYPETMAALELLEEKTTGKLLFDGKMLRREQDFFYFGEIPEENKVTYSLSLGTNEVKGVLLHIDRAERPYFTEDVHSIPEELVEEPLVLRHRQAGDVFQPVGLGGKKKLKDFFIDEKVPLSKRDEYWVLASGKTVFWILGLRKAQIPLTGKSYLQVRVEMQNLLL